MEFWLWMPQLFACTRARIKTQINRGLSPIILSSVKPLPTRKALMEKTLPLVRRTGFVGLHLKPLPEGGCLSPGKIRR